LQLEDEEISKFVEGFDLNHRGSRASNHSGGRSLVGKRLLKCETCHQPPPCQHSVAASLSENVLMQEDPAKKHPQHILKDAKAQRNLQYVNPKDFHSHHHHSQQVYNTNMDPIRPLYQIHQHVYKGKVEFTQADTAMFDANNRSRLLRTQSGNHLITEDRNSEN